MASWREKDFMRSTTLTGQCAVLVTIFTLASIPAQAIDNLGNVLSKSGWDRIIGTWVDAGTRGTRNRITYTWRFTNQVIEATSREGNRNTVSLIGHNPKSGDVFLVSADDRCGSSIGKWTFENGEASLGLLFITGSGEEGALQIRHILEDNDTMIVTVDLPEPIKFKMIRVKQQQK